MKRVISIIKSAGLFFAVCIGLGACKSDSIFSERKYYGGRDVLEFNADKSYNYYLRSESYVNKFNRGVWHQEGDKIILLNAVSDVKELPISYESFPSSETDMQMFINVLPKKNTDWREELAVTDVINIDLLVDQQVYPIKSMTNIIRLKELGHKIYFKAYPKREALHICEILNDTLRSEMIDFKPKTNLVIDIDCNPLYFAQVKIPDDTVRIVNDRKIKWNRIYLERPQ